MERCVVMFSGGMDSFVTALREIDQGNSVDLLVLNSGCILEECNAITMAKRIVKRYGKDHARVAGALSMLGTRLSIERNWKSFSSRDIVKYWASVTGVQAQCFFCQTSMWIGAIAYAFAHDIHTIACGYKATDMFCTGSPAYLNFVKDLSEKFDIKVDVPMWLFEQSVIEADKRAAEMIEHKFAPCVLEPQCCLEMPTRSKLSEGESLQMIDYVRNNVGCTELISELSAKLSVMELSDVSMEPVAKWIKPTDGLY